jgi:membrane-associated phospholipid phosphatase
MKALHLQNFFQHVNAVKKAIVLITLNCYLFLSSGAQYTDSLTAKADQAMMAGNSLNQDHFSLRSYFIPAFLTSYGLFSMKNEEMKELDNSIKNEVWTEPTHRPIKLDNYLQYAPGLAVFGLRAAGIAGKNNLRDEVMLYLISNAVMGAIVNPLKMATHLQRPDGFGRNAFPSGHTATAFVGAEFLNQELKDRSPWYSVAGYTVATGVGLMRIYNNRHWMRDVVAGAGIGMISTKFTYWLYPKIKKLVFEKRDLEKTRITEMSHLSF